MTENVENIENIKEADPENIFVESLAVLTPNDIILNDAAKNIKKQSVDFVRYFMLFLSLAIFVYTGYHVVVKIYSYISAAIEYNGLRDYFYSDEDEEYDSQILKQTRANMPIHDIFTLQRMGEQIIEEEFSAEKRDIEKKQLNTSKIMDINPDFYAWLRVKHTKIDYPVVQTTNNWYYLDYTFEGNRNKSGAIFVDYTNDKNILDNRNLVIYGHNMTDNSMFQPLITYYGHNYSVNNFNTGVIELITLEGTYYYEIFSVRDEDPSSGYIQTSFDSDEEFVEFLNAMKERSYFQKDINLDENSKIITLSTCVNDFTINWRFVVQGVLIEQ